MDTTQSSRILIADDEADARNLIGCALEAPSHELLYAADGSEAMEICRDSLPDIAVIDVQMPGKTGIEVCREIKALAEGCFVPVLLLTCQSEIPDKVHGLDSGADDYITKPFSFAELAARVRSFLRIKKLSDELKKTQNLLAQKERELVAAQVAGAAAHELGQPLTSIVLNAELLNSIDPHSPAFKETLSSLGEECRRIKEILDALTSVERYRVTEYANGLSILDIKQSS